MKQALIHSEYPVADGYRVCQVVDNINETFPVDESMGLSWLECPDEVVADEWYFDTTHDTFAVVPTLFVDAINNVNGYSGEEKTITVNAHINNNYVLYYEWLESNDNGAIFDTIPNETSSTYTFTLAPEFNNRKIYCKVSTDHNVFVTTNIIEIGVF